MAPAAESVDDWAVGAFVIADIMIGWFLAAIWYEIYDRVRETGEKSCFFSCTVVN